MAALSAMAWLSMILPLAGLGPHHAHDQCGQHDTLVGLVHWGSMVCAMMFPLLIGQVRVIAARSLWSRRNRGIAIYLVGFLVPWLLYGLLAIRITRYTPGSRSAVVALIIAAVWQITPWKEQGLRWCHRTDILAPTGWRADADCFNSGRRAACGCLLSCWAVMLPCAMSSAIWMMPVLSLFGFAERSRHGIKPLSFVWFLVVAGVLVLHTKLF